MFKTFFRLFLFASLSFAAMEGFGGHNIQTLYEKVLKSNYEKIAPLKEYAQKRQTTYVISAVLALLVFALFVKYFKAAGALVALLMIAGGIYYLRMQTPAISPYKEKFSEYIITLIAQNCCGYRYTPGKITIDEIKESRIFSPRIKTFTAKNGLYVKKGVKVGYVEIEFDTKENASVERFARNVFSGFVMILDQPHAKEGALVSEPFLQHVADADLDFSTFFADMSRNGKRGGFVLFGDLSQEILDRCGDFTGEEIAVSMTRNKTYLFWYQKNDPLDPGVYAHFDLQAAKGYAKVFEEIDRLVQQCR